MVATDGPNPLDILRALAATDDRFGDEVVAAAAQVGRAAAAGLVLQASVHTSGGTRSRVRAAAQSAADGQAGVADIAGTPFLLIPLGTGAGLALEGGRDSPGLQLFVAALKRSVASTLSADGSTGELQALIAQAPGACIAIDAAGRLHALSRDAEGLLGLTQDFDVGLLAAERLPAALLSEQSVVLKDRPHDIVVVDMPHGGRVLWLVDRSSDVAVERTQEDLVANVAHELRTPIAALSGLMQLLVRRAAKIDPEMLAGLLADGQRELRRLDRTVEDMLLVARVSAGGVAAQRSSVQLGALVREAIADVELRYPGRVFDVRGDGVADADPDLLRHAVAHLVDNAAKFSPETAPVVVEISRSELHVKDQGDGIASADVPGLFNRFKQQDASSTRAHQGMGLGLFLVKELIEAQGGRVWVRSRLGKGSTFSLRLPAG